MVKIENDSELPEPPEGKVRVIDDADLERIVFDSARGAFEAVVTVNEFHLEDVERFEEASNDR